MSFSTLAVAYLIGGITFLPLLLAAGLAFAWYTLPYDDDGDEGIADPAGTPLGDDDGRTKRVRNVLQEERYAADGATSATFAVLRSYNFPAALGALSARGSGGVNSSNARGSADGGVEAGVGGGSGGGGGSESVYQSMYRSVFDRNKNAYGASSVLQNSEEDSGATGAKGKKPAVGASVFFIVLRHGHLMLYDSPAQLEVRHVISLAHHSISLSEGPVPDGGEDVMKDADLFIKRTAIVLTPVLLPNGLHDHSPPVPRPKPFYLFSSTCIEKEDFYHALLTTRDPPPIPQAIRADDLIKLQSILYSTTLTQETRAFNALVGRIFLAIHGTPFLANLVRRKIEKKISRVQKPAFIASLAVRSIDLGDAAPVVSNPRLQDLNISGDMTLAFDVRYNGGVRVVISAMAKLDLGPRFKPRTVDLVLSTSLQRLQGHMLVRIKPPPSNRIWFCFETMPEMEIKVEPVVSQRQITYTFILRAIEERIRGVVAETLIKPNWDDTPFFDTAGQSVRGGIWSDEGSKGDEVNDAEDLQNHKTSKHRRLSELQGQKNEKSMSMPSLAGTAVDADSFVPSSSEATKAPSSMTTSALKDPKASLKRRSVASLPLNASGAQRATASDDKRTPLPPKPLRSPSFTSPSPSMPSVAINDANAGPVRSDDVSLQPKKWRPRGSIPGQGRKEAVDAVREMRDRSLAARGKESSAIAAADEDGPAGVITTEPDELELDESESPLRMKTPQHRSSEEPSPALSPSGSPSRRDRPRRTDSEHSLTPSLTSSASHSRQQQQQQQQQRKNLLAATAAATTAARTWSWNAIANRTGKGRDGSPRQPVTRGDENPPVGDQKQTQQREIGTQPIGRGQPLPPPGMPLPGPQKSLWQTAANGLGRGMIRRKPVPNVPPRPAASAQSTTSVDNHDTEGKARSEKTKAESEVAVDGATANGRGLESQESLSDDVEPSKEVEDEFGPWRENSGVEMANSPATGHDDHPPFTDEGPKISVKDGGDDEIPVVALPADGGVGLESASLDDGMGAVSSNETRQVPPPLPVRRRRTEEDIDRASVDRESVERHDIGASNDEVQAHEDTENASLPTDVPEHTKDRHGSHDAESDNSATEDQGHELHTTTSNPGEALLGDQEDANDMEDNVPELQDTRNELDDEVFGENKSGDDDHSAASET